MPAPVLGNDEQPGLKMPEELVVVPVGGGEDEPVCAWAAGARPPILSRMATAAAATAVVKPVRDSAKGSNLQEQAEARGTSVCRPRAVPCEMRPACERATWFGLRSPHQRSRRRVRAHVGGSGRQPRAPRPGVAWFGQAEPECAGPFPRCGPRMRSCGAWRSPGRMKDILSTCL